MSHEKWLVASREVRMYAIEKDPCAIQYFADNATRDERMAALKGDAMTIGYFPDSAAIGEWMYALYASRGRAALCWINHHERVWGRVRRGSARGTFAMAALWMVAPAVYEACRPWSKIVHVGCMIPCYGEFSLVSGELWRDNGAYHMAVLIWLTFVLNVLIMLTTMN